MEQSKIGWGLSSQILVEKRNDQRQVEEWINQISVYDGTTKDTVGGRIVESKKLSKNELPKIGIEEWSGQRLVDKWNDQRQVEERINLISVYDGTTKDRWKNFRSQIFVEKWTDKDWNWRMKWSKIGW